MATHKTLTKKITLARAHKRVRWAPFWVIPKALGRGKRVHPSRFTRTKRHWRGTKIKLPQKKNITSGKKVKKY